MFKEAKDDRDLQALPPTFGQKDSNWTDVTFRTYHYGDGEIFLIDVTTQVFMRAFPQTTPTERARVARYIYERFGSPDE